LRKKQTCFEIAEICGGFGQIPSFLLLKHVYEGRANPNPLKFGGEIIFYILGGGAGGSAQVESCIMPPCFKNNLNWWPNAHHSPN
jgi:hypothetical protein